MNLSRRLPEELSDSPFFLKLSTLKRSVGEFADLTVSTPLRAGLPFDLGAVLPFAEKGFSVWNPDACGPEDSRKAVARYFADRGGAFSPEDIFLTASTSEAYAILFKVFCNPGDAVLVPQPGYPLLDSLAALECLGTSPYFLSLKNGMWSLDADSLYAFPPNAKILALVSPGNPTGHVLSEGEWSAAVDFALRADMAIVVDEVFGDFIYDGTPRPWNWDSKGVPVFFLGGLSKSVGSPQLKLGWMAVRPGILGSRLKCALEYAADAYLSAASPALSLASPMLEKSLGYENVLRERLLRNLEILRERFPQKDVLPDVRGGWYAALHFDGEDDELLTLRLLKRAKVLVQPGFLFDFDEDGWVVVSLLPAPEVFECAVERLCAEVFDRGSA